MDALLKWGGIAVAAFFAYVAYSASQPSASPSGSDTSGSPHVLTANADNFDAEILESATPILIEFYADW